MNFEFVSKMKGLFLFKNRKIKLSYILIRWISIHDDSKQIIFNSVL